MPHPHDTAARRLHILMYGWEFPPAVSGGLGTACDGLVRALAGRGHQLTLVLPRRLPLPRIAGVTVRPVDIVVPGATPPSVLTPYSRPPASTAAALYGNDLMGQVARYAERAGGMATGIGADIIVAHDWLTFGAALRGSALSGRAWVAHVHATEYDRSQTPVPAVLALEERALASAEAVAAVSRRAAAALHTEFGVPDDRLHVVHNAPGMTPATPVARALPSPPRILFVGRLTEQKQPHLVLAAAARLRATLPGARYVFAGDGDMRPALAAQAGALGLTDSVEFHGFLAGPALAALYASSTVLVLPSRREPFGIVAAEAAAHGLPQVLSTACGAAEVLPAAHLVESPSAESLAAAIAATCASAAHWQRLSAAATTAAAALSWQQAAATCETIYAAAAG
jgi:glycosyltransferase involved in cell wall biosynthesis